MMNDIDIEIAEINEQLQNMHEEDPQYCVLDLNRYKARCAEQFICLEQNGEYGKYPYVQDIFPFDVVYEKSPYVPRHSFFPPEIAKKLAIAVTKRCGCSVKIITLDEAGKLCFDKD